MRTKREIFDIVKAHLLAQGKRAQDRTGCSYRGFDGTKCAVGCLIPDKLYDVAIEGGNFHASSCLEWYPIRKAVPELEAYQGMLQRLVHLHDSVQPDQWADQLNKLGIDEFGLDNQDVCGGTGSAP